MAHTLLTHSAMDSSSSNPGHPLRRARSLTDIASHPSSPREPMPHHMASIIGRPDMDMPGLDVPTLPPRARTAHRHSATAEYVYPAHADPLPALAEEPEPPAPTARAPHDRRGDLLGLPLPRLRRFLAIFGRGRDGTRRRRALIGLLWALGVGGSAMIVAIALLAVAAHTNSPTVPGETEWHACQQPLVAWDVVWILKTALASCLSVWSWKTNSRRPSQQPQRPTNEPTTSPTSLGGVNGFPPPPDVDPTPQLPETPSRRQRSRSPPVPPLYTRLSVLSSLLGFIWFVAAHIFLFTTVKTCLPSSPHVWWLTVGLLSLSYLAVAELVLIGLVIFLIGPVVFIGLNLVLFVLGRHPLQNPLGITPPVGKLSRNTVERIPLVMYIPAPPENEGNEPEDGVQSPPAAHVYPPQTGPAKKKRRFRFALLRRRKPKKDAAAGMGKHADDDTEPATWEENWLSTELPFVRLASNRASCAICLMDFAEPPRAKGSKLPLPGAATSEPGEVAVGSGEPETEHRVQGEVDASMDVSEEAEPLRLLPCGHAFHKTCLDPWLIDISGRCPMCQRAVEDSDDPKPKRRWRMRRRPPPNQGEGADAV